MDEDTPDDVFVEINKKIDKLSDKKYNKLKQKLVDLNSVEISNFIEKFLIYINKRIKTIAIIPLHGQRFDFQCVSDGIDFINTYKIKEISNYKIMCYKLIIEYDNGSIINAEFVDSMSAISFLNSIS